MPFFMHKNNIVNMLSKNANAYSLKVIYARVIEKK